jgi:hypothetical protein
MAASGGKRSLDPLPGALKPKPALSYAASPGKGPARGELHAIEQAQAVAGDYLHFLERSGIDSVGHHFVGTLC